MAMFVLVVDTSLMNVSISAVVEDLDTTVSGVQSAIALEALVSAAFILIGSKVGDLIGRKRAYVLGPARLRHRRAGDDARPEPDRDHHLLGDHRRARRVAPAARDAVAHPRQLRRRGAEARSTRSSAPRPRSPPPSDRCSAASSRPTCRGASASCSRSSIIAIVLSGIKLVHDVPYTGAGEVDVVGAVLSVLGMGGIVLGILVWQEGGEAVAALLAHRRRSRSPGSACWLVRRKRAGQADADRSGPVHVQALPARASPSRCSSRSRSAAR